MAMSNVQMYNYNGVCTAPHSLHSDTVPCHRCTFFYGPPHLPCSLSTSTLCSLLSSALPLHIHLPPSACIEQPRLAFLSGLLRLRAPFAACIPCAARTTTLYRGQQ